MEENLKRFGRDVKIIKRLRQTARIARLAGVLSAAAMAAVVGMDLYHVVRGT